MKKDKLFKSLEHAALYQISDNLLIALNNASIETDKAQLISDNIEAMLNHAFGIKICLKLADKHTYTVEPNNINGLQQCVLDYCQHIKSNEINGVRMSWETDEGGNDITNKPFELIDEKDDDMVTPEVSKNAACSQTVYERIRHGILFLEMFQYLSEEGENDIDNWLSTTTSTLNKEEKEETTDIIRDFFLYSHTGPSRAIAAAYILRLCNKTMTRLEIILWVARTQHIDLE